MNNAICFRLRLAQLLIQVSCLHKSSRQLCRDYLSEETASPDMSISIAPQSLAREQAMLLRKGDPGANNPGTVESYALCRYIADALPARDRVLFHGSALAIDGQGVLFTAKSGTGKSTHTRLWRQVFADRVTMVNDDKPFLHIGSDTVTVYGTPWQGKHRLGSNTSAPLRAVCILCRGEENRIEPVSPREALPLLLQQTYSPADPGAMGKTLELVERLSRTVPIYRLQCNMDPAAACVACRGLGLL